MLDVGRWMFDVRQFFIRNGFMTTTLKRAELLSHILHLWTQLRYIGMLNLEPSGEKRCSADST